MRQAATFVFWLLAAASVSASSRSDLRGYDKLGPFDYSAAPNPRIREFVMAHWTERRRGYAVFTTRSADGDTVKTELFIEPGKRGSWRIRGILTGALADRFGQQSSKNPEIPVTKKFEAVSLEWGWDIGFGSVIILKDKEGEVVDSV